MSFETHDGLLIVGLAAVWYGAIVYWIAGLPRQLKSGRQPTAEKGTPQAFGLFWMDQYAYIGLTTGVAGVILLVASVSLR
jgi:hypothetical protein